MCLYFINHVTMTVTFNYSYTCSLYYYGESTNKLLLYMGTWYFLLLFMLCLMACCRKPYEVQLPEDVQQQSTNNADAGQRSIA